ncbi:serpentine type 7TM GPCR chemoreceptor str domain-containing protein [Ditylenchus destructor]|nr:serpentine type 7TM GPCR chemoreceptor str domain-containing protein [Ditylenchus destructor]
MADGVLIFVVNGFIKELPICWHYTFIWLFICTANMTLLVVPIEFVFRYMLICRNITLSAWQLVGLGFIVFILSAFDSSLAIFSLTGTSDHQVSFGHLMSDPIWSYQSGRQVLFVGADHSNIFLILFLGIAGLYNGLSCGIMLCLGFATFRILKESQHNMSAKTRNMQTQMNRILVAEACAVLFIINVPIGGMLATLFFKINIPGVGIFMSMVMVWITLSNPIVTMLLVAQYRRTVVGWFRPNYRRNMVSAFRAARPGLMPAMAHVDSHPAVHPSSALYVRRVAKMGTGQTRGRSSRYSLGN